MRLGLGSLMVAHGAQKLFDWFGGAGLSGTAQFLGSLRLRPPRVWAIAVAVSEITAGLLTITGLLGPVGPALILAVMLAAIMLVHWRHGFWNTDGGFEFPALLAVTATGLSLMGHGRYALDEVLGLDLHEAEIIVPTLVIAVLGTLAGIVIGRHMGQDLQPGGGAPSAADSRLAHDLLAHDLSRPGSAATTAAVRVDPVATQGQYQPVHRVTRQVRVVAGVWRSR